VTRAGGGAGAGVGGGAAADRNPGAAATGPGALGPDPEAAHPQAADPEAAGPGRVWYVSYGSNMSTERLRTYLHGGRPAGGTRTYPGCRDPRMPRRSVAVELPGTVYFATTSPVWGGGRAFYDPDAPGVALARAHLLTAEQFCDIAAQEMYRAPVSGASPGFGGRTASAADLAAAVAAGRVRLGPGRYETLVRAGERDGLPLLTFTAPWALDDVPWTRPSAPYLAYLLAGLLEAGRWSPTVAAGYLASRPGAAGYWTPEAVRALAAPAHRPGGGAP
jgi:hypothetical protein